MSIVLRFLRFSSRVCRRLNPQAVKPLLTALGLIVCFEREARAYTDPGTGALLWQALVAGLVGVLFYFRKFTSWFKGKKKRTED